MDLAAIGELYARVQDEERRAMSGIHVVVAPEMKSDTRVMLDRAGYEPVDVIGHPSVEPGKMYIFRDEDIQLPDTMFMDMQRGFVNPPHRIPLWKRVLLHYE